MLLIPGHFGKKLFIPLQSPTFGDFVAHKQSMLLIKDYVVLVYFLGCPPLFLPYNINHFMSCTNAGCYVPFVVHQMLHCQLELY